MLRFILFFLLVAMPIAEIAVFLVVGEAIGALSTILIIILTAVIGTILLRRQGLQALTRLREDSRAGRVPAAAIGHAITVAIAGALLLTPGFITDTIGFALFIPAVRRGLWRLIASSFVVRSVGGSPLGPGPSRDDGFDSGPKPGPAGGFGSPPRRGPQTINLDSDEYESREPDGSPWRGPDGTDRR